MIRTLAMVAAMAAVAGAAADSKAYNYRDPKGVNAMYFLLDSPLEPIMGLARGISGEVTFDPADAKATRGQIVVDSETVQTSNEKMTEHLHSGQWIDVDKNPEIKFVIGAVKSAEKTGEHDWKLELAGDFTLNGTTRPMVIPVEVTHVAGGAAKRMRGASGDLLVLRAKFTINRSEFGIKPGEHTEAVAEEIQITAPIVGMSKG